MNYEEKYKDALEKAEGIIRYYKEHNRDEASIEDLETIFPELRESEDERIRKSLIKHFREYESCTFDGLSSTRVLDWLEKQGENPINHTDEEIVEAVKDTSILDMVEPKDYSSIDPHFFKTDWSEEDEMLCQCLIEDQEEALDDVCNDKYGHSEIISDLKEMYRERIDWLKSLKRRIG